MNCTGEFINDILKECGYRPSQGTVEAYYGNLADLAASGVSKSTDGGVITGITMTTGKKLFKVEGYSSSTNSGVDTFTDDDFGGYYEHRVRMNLINSTAASNDELFQMKGARVFVILKLLSTGSDGSGQFEVYGLSTGNTGLGMVLNVNTKDTNANGGVRNIEFASKDQEFEACPPTKFWNTDAATTDAAIATLLLPAP